MMEEKQVNVLIAGKIGENMHSALADAGIKAIELQGTVSEVLSQI